MEEPEDLGEGAEEIEEEGAEIDSGATMPAEEPCPCGSGKLAWECCGA